MKAIDRILPFLLCTAGIFASCTEDELLEIGKEIPMTTITLNAGYPETGDAPEMNPDTRTEIAEGSLTPLWSSGDHIGAVSIRPDQIFLNSPMLNDSKTAAARTTFTGSIAADASSLLCYYPYQPGEVTSTGGKNMIRLNIPDTQSPRRNTFDGNADLMTAASIAAPEGSFDGSGVIFQRRGAVMKIVLTDATTGKELEKEKIRSLSVKNDGPECRFTGYADLDTENGELTRIYDNNSSAHVSATLGADEQYVPDGEEGTFLIVYPQTLKKDSHLTVSGMTTTKKFETSILLKSDIALPEAEVTTLKLKLKDGNISRQKEAKAWTDFDSGSPENVLLDFSYAGYDHGNSAPPEGIPAGWTEYNVTDYGLVPDDGQSDRAAFEKLVYETIGINKTANVKAVIHFPAGEFILHDEGDNTRDAGSANQEFTDSKGNNRSHEILLNGGNFIIRGAGRDKTRIIMASPNLPDDSKKMYSSPDMILIKSPSGIGTNAITPVTGKADSFSVNVGNASKISQGDWVCLYLDCQTPSPAILGYEFGSQEWEVKNKRWSIEDIVEVRDLHQVKSVNGSTVTFHEPIMREFQQDEQWEIRKYNHYENVGIEDLTFVGNAKPDFIHHASWEDDGAYKPISMNRMVNSWMRRVGFESVSECATFSECANCSAYDIEITGNRGHSGVRSAGSSRIFLGKIHDHSHGFNIEQGQQLGSLYMEDAGQYHASGVSKPSMGAVLWRNHWGKDATFESHSGQPRATLVDHCRGGWVEWRFGGAQTEIPNHLIKLTLWNMETEKFYGRPEQLSNYKWWTNDINLHWRVSPPVVVGFHGVPAITFDTTSSPAQMEYHESLGTPVLPESLYEAQMRKRNNGQLPQWLESLKALP